MAAARNTGIKESNSDLIVFLDSDDAFTQNSLKYRYESLLLDSTLFACGCSGLIKPIKPQFDLSDIVEFEATDKNFTSKYISLETLQDANCPFNCHGPMIWKFFLSCCNYHSESMRKGAEDYDFGPDYYCQVFTLLEYL